MPRALPDAPCSVNAIVDYPGKPRTQITGRGQTGEEAVGKFDELHTAMLARYGGPPDPLAILSSFLVKALGKAQRLHDPAYALRIMKAAQIAMMDDFERDPEYGEIVAVISQSDPLKMYAVDAHFQCACQSAKKLNPAKCKHTLSIIIKHKMEGRK